MMLMKFFRYLLFPLAILYHLITAFRNYLYKIGVFKRKQAPVFTICVGNLTVGGTGKTPHIEYLIRLLQAKFQIATLSRGYGRKTKGFLVADNHSTANILGDEPMQFFVKYGNKIVVSVGEKRVAATEKLLQLHPNLQIILLDDAFQHLAIKAHLNILLTDYYRPFYQDYLLPTGELRESRKGAKRADIVIVTKCLPTITLTEKSKIVEKIREYANENTPILFSYIRYLALQPLYTNNNSKDVVNFAKNQNVILVTGLANNKTLQSHIAQQYNLLTTLTFADHQDYTTTKLQEIINTYQKNIAQNPVLITTEKDMVKLQHYTFRNKLKSLPIYYLPIEVYFLEEDEALFLETLRKFSSLL